MRKILMATAALLLGTTQALAHGTFVYVPVYAGGQAGPPPFAVVDAASGHFAGTTEYQNFLLCDGFGRIDGQSDEMNQINHAVMFDHGVHPQIRYPKLPVLGSAGAEACTRALADTALGAGFPARRAHLLLYRALHRTVAGDAAGVTADLDAASKALAEAGHDDALARSLGLDITLVAAFGAAQAKDGEKAKALFQTVADARPDVTQLLAAAPAFYGLNARLPDGQDVLPTLARENPGWRGTMFLKAALDGNYQLVTELYGVLSDSYLASRNLKMMPDLEGHQAYALSTLGKSAQAEAVLAAASAYLAAHTPAEPTPLAAGATEGRREAGERSQAISTRQAMLATKAQLDKWTDYIALRKTMLAAAPADTSALLAKLPTDVPLDIRLDLIRLAKTKGPLSDSTQKMADYFRDHALEVLTKNLPPDPTKIERALFYPERYTLVPQGFYRGADYAGFKWANPGQCSHTAEGEGIVSYRCANEVNMPAVIDEVILINAALDARHQGKTAIVIRSRTTTHHLVNNTLHNGYDTIMALDFVDGANLPEKYRAVPWAVIPTDAILKRLMPFYAHPAPAGT